jgi:hypothetical protein
MSFAVSGAIIQVIHPELRFWSSETHTLSSPAGLPPTPTFHGGSDIALYRSNINAQITPTFTILDNTCAIVYNTGRLYPQPSLIMQDVHIATS